MASPQPTSPGSAAATGSQSSQTSKSSIDDSLPSATSSRNPKFPPLTTQLVQADPCSSIFTLATKTVTSYTSYPYGPYGGARETQQPSTVFWTLSTFTSDTAAPRFSSCQAPGWDLASMTFSPGVCPSGWTYFNMHAYDYDHPSTEFGKKSSATCCAPSYWLQTVYGGTPGTCLSITSTSFTGNTTTFAHTPYVVLWEAKDVYTMAVSPPSLDSYRSISHWVPGSSLRPWDGYSNGPSESYLSTSLVLLITLPIVGFFAILSVIILCALHSRKKRRLNNAKHELAEMSPATDGASQESLEAGSDAQPQPTAQAAANDAPPTTTLAAAPSPLPTTTATTTVSTIPPAGAPSANTDTTTTTTTTSP